MADTVSREIFDSVRRDRDKWRATAAKWKAEAKYWEEQVILSGRRSNGMGRNAAQRRAEAAFEALAGEDRGSN